MPQPNAWGTRLHPNAQGGRFYLGQVPMWSGKEGRGKQGLGKSEDKKKTSCLP